MNGTPFAVLILAGGRARRFPGKLRAAIGDRTLLERVVTNFASISERVIAVDAAFDRDLAAALASLRIVVDRSPELGPLGGIETALAVIRATNVFVVAGDAPFVDASLAHSLAARWEAGIDAVVPRHGNPKVARSEPLAAFYTCDALAIAAREEREHGNGSLHGVLARLRVRYVGADARYFANVNTPLDLARIRAEGDVREPSHDAT